MKKVKINLLKTLLQNIETYMSKGDVIVYEFDVVPLDYNVQNFETPRITVTTELLVFSYDENMEFYALNEVALTFEGEEPKFTIWQQFFEGRNLYSPCHPEQLQKMREFDNLPRISITPTGKPSHDFVPRNGQIVHKPYQTWAVFQLLQNLKNQTPNDPLLHEMVSGNFTTFNTKTVLTFIIVFLVFMLVHALASWLFPELVSTILEFLFGGVLIGMTGWVAVSLDKNNSRFQQVFRRYKPVRNQT